MKQRARPGDGRGTRNLRGHGGERARVHAVGKRDDSATHRRQLVAQGRFEREDPADPVRDLVHALASHGGGTTAVVVLRL